MANEQTLTGIELREAVLRAAGWATFEWEAGLYGLRKPDGKPLLAYQDFTIKMAHSWVSEADAWQHAPAVESSVDAALMLIDDIPATFHLESPAPKFWRCWFHTVPMVIGDGDTPAEAMCRAYLAWKAGA